MVNFCKWFSFFFVSSIQGKGEKLTETVADLLEDADDASVEAKQAEIEATDFTASAGGGAVEVTVSGKKEVLKVKLKEEVVDPEDIEMLEDLIVAATNEALRKVDEASQASMSKITGGLGGGMF